MFVSFILYCFFFQAEDGIRDFHVTGVQTCALPIWGIAEAKIMDQDVSFRYLFQPVLFIRLFVLLAMHLAEPFIADTGILGGTDRSEERRVGKSVERWGRRCM